MYNEEQKRRYMDFCQGNYSDDYITSLISIFNKSAEFEQLFNKDICEFSRENISDYYAYIRYSDEYVYSSVNSRLKNYAEWCISENLVPDGCNHFAEFTLLDFGRYINVRLEAQKYMSDEEYERICGTIANKRDEFLFRCLYEFGKSENYCEILELKLEDIDMASRKAFLPTGRVVTLSERLVIVARIANDELEYFTPNKTKRMDRVPTIFKKVRGYSGTGEEVAPDFGNKLVARVVKSIVSTGGGYHGINPASVAMSGQMSMIRRRSRELGIAPRDYVLKYFSELQEQYNLTPNDPRKFLKKYEPYL